MWYALAHGTHSPHGTRSRTRYIFSRVVHFRARGTYSRAWYAFMRMVCILTHGVHSHAWYALAHGTRYAFARRMHSCA